MKNIIRTFFFLTVVLSLTGCFDQPEFKEFSNFKVDEFNKNKITFNVDVSIFNPNGYNLKIRKSKFDVFVNDLFIGKAKVLKRFKMKRKDTTTNNVPIELNLEKGVFFKVITLARSSKKIELRLKGPLKASASILPVRKKIDESKMIDLGDLNIKGMGAFN